MAAPDPNRCSTCGSGDLRPVFELSDIPVLVCTLWPDAASARACPKGDIRLESCPACGLIENHAYEPARVEYGEGYENSLHFSEFFQGYLQAFAERLVAEHRLAGRTVAEIGCGDGGFLELLVQAGIGKGIGFDPSYPPTLPEVRAGGRVRVVRDTFRSEPGALAADAVVCRQVLEHVAEPRRFLEAVRAALRPGTRPPVVFEVPNTRYTLEHTSLWDVIYEHRTYFTRGSLARLFAAAGFEVTQAEETYEGQFLAVAARPAAGAGSIAIPVESAGEIDEAAERFSGAARERVAAWTERLDRLRRAGARVALWGAGARGVTFLNVADPERSIGIAVDLNPRKHGLYLAGSAQQVRPPADLRELRPELVILTNPVYRREIERDLAGMGLHTEIALA